MAVDITGFQRMRRQQSEKQVNAAEPAWEGVSYSELKTAAKEAGIKGYGKMNKEQLIEALKSR
jgi:hypothetical protein